MDKAFDWFTAGNIASGLIIQGDTNITGDSKIPLLGGARLREKMSLLGIQMNFDDVEDMIREADFDHDGLISLEDFRTVMNLMTDFEPSSKDNEGAEGEDLQSDVVCLCSDCVPPDNIEGVESSTA